MKRMADTPKRKAVGSNPAGDASALSRKIFTKSSAFFSNKIEGALEDFQKSGMHSLCVHHGTALPTACTAQVIINIW